MGSASGRLLHDDTIILDCCCCVLHAPSIDIVKTNKIAAVTAMSSECQNTGPQLFQQSAPCANAIQVLMPNLISNMDCSGCAAQDSDVLHVMGHSPPCQHDS